MPPFLLKFQPFSIKKARPDKGRAWSRYHPYWCKKSFASASLR